MQATKSNMKKDKLRDLAYFAGIMDSDGCFQIVKKKTKYFLKKENRWKEYEIYDPRLAVDQADTRVINWLYGRFGGTVGIAKKGKRIAIGNSRKIYTEKDLFYWRLNIAKKMIPILKQIIPILKIKKRQAEIVVNIAQLRYSRYKRQKPYTNLEMNRLRKYWLDIKKEKQKYFTELCMQQQRLSDKTSLKDDAIVQQND